MVFELKRYEVWTIPAVPALPLLDISFLKIISGTSLYFYLHRVMTRYLGKSLFNDSHSGTC